MPETVDPATGDPIPPASPHLVLVALRRAFAHAGVAMPPVRVTSRNRVPVSSGFGSSSAAIVGGLVAGLVLAGVRVRAAPRSAPAPGSSHQLPQTRGRDAPADDGECAEALLQLATELEAGGKV